MPNQPGGAVTVPVNGSIGGVKFGPGGTTMWVAVGSEVRGYDTATKSLTTTLTFSGIVRAFDISADGATVVAATDAPYQLYRATVSTGNVTSALLPGPPFVVFPEGVISDIVVLNTGQILVAQNTSQPAPVLRINFDQPIFTFAATTPIVRPNLVPSADRDTVLIVEANYSWTMRVFTTANNLVVSTRVYNPDPFAGASVPVVQSVGALAPDETNYAFGPDLRITDGSGLRQTAIEAPFGDVKAIAYDQGGAAIYVLVAGAVAKIDLATGRALATYGLDSAIGGIPNVSGAEALQISPDGRFLSVQGSSGVQLIDLSIALPDSDGTDNDLSAGAFLYGLAGNDILGAYAARGQFLFGGSGDDTYRVGDLNAVSIRERAGEGTDLILLEGGVGLMPDFIENLTVVGALGSQVIGNGMANVMTGGAGGDVLYGGLGSDQLSGGAGNDLLASGVSLLDPDLEVDRLHGGDGDDRLAIGWADEADGGAGDDAVILSLTSTNVGGYLLYRRLHARGFSVAPGRRIHDQCGAL